MATIQEILNKDGIDQKLKDFLAKNIANKNFTIPGADLDKIKEHSANLLEILQSFNKANDLKGPQLKAILLSANSPESMTNYTRLINHAAKLDGVKFSDVIKLNNNQQKSMINILDNISGEKKLSKRDFKQVAKISKTAEISSGLGQCLGALLTGGRSITSNGWFWPFKSGQDRLSDLVKDAEPIPKAKAAILTELAKGGSLSSGSYQYVQDATNLHVRIPIDGIHDQEQWPSKGQYIGKIFHAMNESKPPIPLKDNRKGIIGLSPQNAKAMANIVEGVMPNDLDKDVIKHIRQNIGDLEPKADNIIIFSTLTIKTL